MKAGDRVRIKAADAFDERSPEFILMSFVSKEMVGQEGVVQARLQNSPDTWAFLWVLCDNGLRYFLPEPTVSLVPKSEVTHAAIEKRSVFGVNSDGLYLAGGPASGPLLNSSLIESMGFELQPGDEIEVFVRLLRPNKKRP